MKMTEKEFERFVMDLGLKLEIPFGEFWYNFFPSGNVDKTGNYRAHFNCDVPDIMDKIKDEMKSYFDCVFFNDCQCIDVHKLGATYEDHKYQYNLHFKMIPKMPKVVQMTDECIADLIKNNPEHAEEFGTCIGDIVGLNDLGRGLEEDTYEVRWRPSGLKYMYPISDLDVIER